MEFDVVGMFEELERESREALQKIAGGEAKNGVSALQRIRAKSEDAARWSEKVIGRRREDVRA